MSSKYKIAACIRPHLLVPYLSGRSLGRLMQSTNLVYASVNELNMLWHMLIRRDITPVWQIDHHRPALGDTYDDADRKRDRSLYTKYYLAYRLLNMNFYQDLLVVRTDLQFLDLMLKVARLLKVSNQLAYSTVALKKHVNSQNKSVVAMRLLAERLRTLDRIMLKQRNVNPRNFPQYKMKKDKDNIDRKQRQISHLLSQIHGDLSAQMRWQLLGAWEPRVYKGEEGEDPKRYDTWARRRAAIEALLKTWTNELENLKSKLAVAEPTVFNANLKYEVADKDLQTELHKLYRQGARVYHPDKRRALLKRKKKNNKKGKGHEPDPKKIWDALERAKDVLLDPAKRKLYNSCDSHNQYVFIERSREQKKPYRTQYEKMRARRQGLLRLTAGVPNQARMPMAAIEGKTHVSGSRVRVRWFPAGCVVTSYALRITPCKYNPDEDFNIDTTLGTGLTQYLSPPLLPSGGVVSVQIAMRNVFGQGLWSQCMNVSLPGFESISDRRARDHALQLEQVMEDKKAAKRLHNMYTRRLRKYYTQLHNAVDDVNEWLDMSARSPDSDDQSEDSDDETEDTDDETEDSEDQSEDPDDETEKPDDQSEGPEGKPEDPDDQSEGRDNKTEGPGIFRSLFQRIGTAAFHLLGRTRGEDPDDETEKTDNQSQDPEDETEKADDQSEDPDDESEKPDDQSEDPDDQSEDPDDQSKDSDSESEDSDSESEDPVLTAAEIQDNLCTALTKLNRRYTRATSAFSAYKLKYGGDSSPGYWVLEDGKSVWKPFEMGTRVLSRIQNADSEAAQILEAFADVLEPGSKGQTSSPVPENSQEISQTTTTNTPITQPKPAAKPKGEVAVAAKPKPKGKVEVKPRPKGKVEVKGKGKDAAAAEDSSKFVPPPHPPSAPPRSPFKIFLSHGHAKEDWKGLDGAAKAEYKGLAKAEQAAHRDWRQEREVIRFFGGPRSLWETLSTDEQDEWRRRHRESEDSESHTNGIDIPVGRNHHKKNKRSNKNKSSSKQQRQNKAKSSARKERRRR